MAVNLFPWVRNINGASEPYIQRMPCAAGTTRTIKKGEICYLSTNMIPLASDTSMSAVIGIANEEIKTQDAAGYYEFILPRPGDVFRYPLASASNPSPGASLYYSTSQAVTTSGTNVLGNVVTHPGIPKKQAHLSDGEIADYGTTIANTSFVEMTIKASTSLYAAYQG